MTFLFLGVAWLHEKTQIEDIFFSLSGARTHESILDFRAEIQEYFRLFLVQMKIAKSPLKLTDLYKEYWLMRVYYTIELLFVIRFEEAKATIKY